MIEIYVWPCGTWCKAEDIGDYGWMSDDYVAFHIHASATDKDIERAAEEAISMPF